MLLLLVACFPELEVPEGLTGNPYTDYDGDGFSLVDGDCDDEDATRHPAATESCNGVDDDCDGEEDNDCDTAASDDTADPDDTGEVEPASFVGWPAQTTVSAAATWTLPVGVQSVAMGDIDGDGVDDIVLGNASAGRVLIYLGKDLGSPGELTVAAATAVVQGANDFGWSVAMGDIEGDGKLDLLVGERNHTGGDKGSVTLVPGTTLETLTGDMPAGDISQWQIKGDEGEFGYRVDFMDVDDNGQDEVVIVERFGESGAGVVYVLEAVDAGSATGTKTIGDFSTRSIVGNAGDESGYSLSICDVDGDGRDDIWAGSNTMGGARLFAGSELNPGEAIGPTDAVWSLTGFVDQVGVDTSCGDVDGGGDDLLMLAYSKNRAYVVLAGNLAQDLDLEAGAADYTLEGSPTFARYGLVADIDGDGLADVLSGGPTGAVQLRLASELDSPPPAATSFTQMGLEEFDMAAGDLDGDGLNDLVIADTRENQVYILLTPSAQ
jgi:hypothetical protein